MTDSTAEDELTFLNDGRSVSFRLHESVYPLDAIYGAAYLFVDRCYVFLTRPGDGQVDVRLRAKEQTDAERLTGIAGEFANELLNQVLRFRISESTSRIREYYMARAFLSTPAQSTIDRLLADLDNEEREDDPLDIAVPWQEGPRA
jgi:His-Xaa-Ser system protein HxsD